MTASDEKFFDLDEIYNAQNDRMWASSREADKRVQFMRKLDSRVKMTVWLGVCAQGFTMPVILENGTMDAEKYIEKVFSLAIKLGNKT